MKVTEKELLQYIAYLETIVKNLPFKTWFKDTQGMPLSFNIPTTTNNENIKELTNTYRERTEKGVYEISEIPVFNHDGSPLGTAGFSIDITEEILLASFPGAAYRSKDDKEYTMTFISDGCYQLTGYKAEDLVNKNPPYYELIPKEYRDKLIEKWKSDISPYEVCSEEYPIVTASGQIKWVWEQYQEMRNSSEEYVATEGFITDITARKLAEEEILYLSHHNQLTGIFNRRYYELALCRMDKPENLPMTLVLADVNGLKLINDAFGHLAGDQLLKTVASILQSHCREEDVAAKIGGDEFVLLLPKTNLEEAEELICKIRSNISREKINNIYCSVSFGLATKKDPMEEIENIYMQAEDKMYRNKFFESSSMRSDTIEIITKTLYEKNKEEQLHCERVSKLCEAIGRALRLSSSDIGELRMAGLMHDIGKIGIDQRLLTKNRRFSDEEWSDIKRHPEIGYQILKSIGELSPIAEYVLYHHERVDGGGYPRGIVNTEIPIQSKIISIANAYDRMTEYCYQRSQLSKAEAIREIYANVGTQFDKNIAKIFVKKVLFE